MITANQPVEPLQDINNDHGATIHYENDYNNCNGSIEDCEASIQNFGTPIRMEDYNEYIEDYSEIHKDNMILEWIREDIYASYRSVGIQTPDHLFESHCNSPHSKTADHLVDSCGSKKQTTGAMVLESIAVSDDEIQRDTSTSNFVIPQFTVTINPMEPNEVTFVPDSPDLCPTTATLRRCSVDVFHKSRAGSTTSLSGAQTPDNLLRRCSVGSGTSRRSSVGSATSLAERGRFLGLTVRGADARRVSDISCINQLKREMGMSHLSSEYYEVIEMNPDVHISLDSIHQRVLERCANKYEEQKPAGRGPVYFVLISLFFTAVGITGCIWLKNFVPELSVAHS